LSAFGILHDISLPEILKTATLLGKMHQEGFPLRLLLVGKSETRSQKILETWIREKGFQNWIACDLINPRKMSQSVFAPRTSAFVFTRMGFQKKGRLFMALLGHGVPVIGTQRGKLPPELKRGRKYSLYSGPISRRGVGDSF